MRTGTLVALDFSQSDLQDKALAALGNALKVGARTPPSSVSHGIIVT